MHTAASEESPLMPVNDDDASVRLPPVTVMSEEDSSTADAALGCSNDTDVCDNAP